MENLTIKHLTLSEIKALNSSKGHFFFEKNTVRAFGSKISKVKSYNLFITIEDNFNRTKRLYTLRICLPDGNICTLGDFQAYNTLAQAEAEANKIIGALKTMGNREKLTFNTCSYVEAINPNDIGGNTGYKFTSEENKDNSSSDFDLISTDKGKSYRITG